jgi:hypothetical protein
MDQYEGFTPDGLHNGQNGKLFLEMTPITFPIKVKPGIALSKLRLFLGSPASARMVRNLPSIQKQLYRPASRHPRVAPEPLFDLEDSRSKPALGLLRRPRKFFAKEPLS